MTSLHSHDSFFHANLQRRRLEWAPFSHSSCVALRLHTATPKILTDLHRQRPQKKPFFLSCPLSRASASCVAAPPSCCGGISPRLGVVWRPGECSTCNGQADPPIWPLLASARRRLLASNRAADFGSRPRATTCRRRTRPSPTPMCPPSPPLPLPSLLVPRLALLLPCL